jgi:hypothetical protein
MQLDHLAPLLAAAPSDGRQTDEVVETGIKVIDVMCRSAPAAALQSPAGMARALRS